MTTGAPAAFDDGLEILMTRKFLLIAIVAASAALGLSGCGASTDSILTQMDSHFAACTRHITFQGGVGVITPGAQVSGSVDCAGSAAAPAPAASTAAAQ